jgi:hypothetical protein
MEKENQWKRIQKKLKMVKVEDECQKLVRMEMKKEGLKE